MGLKNRLHGCLGQLKVCSIFGHASIVMILVVDPLIDYRRLSDLRNHQDDPMVRPTLGLSRLPVVAAVSSTLGGIDKTAVNGLHRNSRSRVIERLKKYAPARLTLDFDGSVIGTTRMADATSGGYKRKR